MIVNVKFLDEVIITYFHHIFFQLQCCNQDSMKPYILLEYKNLGGVKDISLEFKALSKIIMNEQLKSHHLVSKRRVVCSTEIHSLLRLPGLNFS